MEGTLDAIAHVKLFRYRIYSFQKPTMVKGRRGMRDERRVKNCKVSPDFCPLLSGGKIFQNTLYLQCIGRSRGNRWC